MESQADGRQQAPTRLSVPGQAGLRVMAHWTKLQRKVFKLNYKGRYLNM